jgi:NDP-sugar pyrophosphorylase family protein
MIETVGRVISVSGSDRFIMGMPDTFFYGDSPYRLLSEADGIARLALWKIRPEQIGKLGQVKTSESTGEVIDVQDKNPNCTYEYSWGAMSFSRTAFDLADESMTTLGDIIPKLIETKNRVTSALIEGVYYDCGTPLEYYSMLANTVDND